MKRRTFLKSLGATAAIAAIGRPAVADQAAATQPLQHPRGVNLCGAEFGTGDTFSNENPGQVGREYTYNTEATVAALAKQGFTIFRVPFRWERIQPKLGLPLDQAELDRLTQLVGWIAKHNGQAILDVHNFARYTLVRNGKPVSIAIDVPAEGGEKPVTRDHFVDLWRRLSIAFKTRDGIYYYGLMNEPFNFDRVSWQAISQAAVDAIRANGDTTRILVPGIDWSSAARFADANGTTAWIKDTHETVYEAHLYLDDDASGAYKLTYDQELAKDGGVGQRGVRRLIQFAGWCAVNKVDGFIGEFGVPGNDPRWINALAQLVNAMDAANIRSCYWAAGEWWGEYPLSIQPRDGKPAPQVKAILGST